MKTYKPISILKTFRLGYWKRNISYLLVIALLNMLVGCYYYKVRNRSIPGGDEIIELQSKNKFIMVHCLDEVWNLKNITIDGNELTGTISSFKGHEKYKTTRPVGANRYRKYYSEEDVVNEVHIYINSCEKIEEQKISIPLSNIVRIDVYDRDIGKTVASWMTGFTVVIGGIAALTFVTLMIIALLTKESCPFIYVWDGKNYQFSGEIYSGSILPPLERHDYLPLAGLKEENGQYRLKISNEIHEIQHTNLTKLVVFDHPEGSKVLIDKYGAYQTATDLKTPVTAINFQGKNILDRVASQDSLSYFGDETAKETDGVIMSFLRPESIKTGKLFIKAKNTFWLDYVVGRFHNLFGSSYNKWQEKQKTAPESKLREWSLNQNIPLSVYVEKNGKWVFLDYYHLAGPMAFKEDVLPIDLSGLDTDTLKIKLESGSFFWDIDYAGMDYTKNLELKSYEIPLQNAVDNNGKDVTALMREDDSNYYIQPEIGDRAELTFPAPEATAARRTVILHSKGYYEIILKPSGIADREYLETFREPGRFTKYSREMLQSFTKNTEK